MAGSSLEGEWFNRSGECVATIQDGVLSFVNGPCAMLTWRGTSGISVEIEGSGEYSAVIDCTGGLSWSDGDAWVRRQRRGAAETPGSRGRSRPSWERCGGSGGAGVSPFGCGDIPAHSRTVIQDSRERLPLCESSLVPYGTRSKDYVPMGWSHAQYLILATNGFTSFTGRDTKPVDGCRFSADIDKDSAARVLISSTVPAYLLIELNAMSTYNMMDACLAWDLDFACDAALIHMNRSYRNTYCPVACMNQGSGPHYCPGGNPNPMPYPGLSKFDCTQHPGYSPYVRIREMGVPIVSATHGTMVGGGCAYSLNSTVRCCAHNTTVCFGNISRGAVPGMMLSKNVMTTNPYYAGLNLYLTDNTLSAYHTIKAGFMNALANGPQNSKALGAKMMKDLSNVAEKSRLLPIQPFFDVEVFEAECIGIDFSARWGGIFANVKTKTVEELIAEQEEVVAELPPLPAGMPGRLPGQHLKGLRPGDQAICTMCGQKVSAGWWGQDKSDIEGMFFCTSCWAAVTAPAADSSGKKKKKKPQQQAQAPAPQTVPERAVALHGPQVDGGILSWAQYTATCCPASMEPSADKKWEASHMPYCSEKWKERHRNVQSFVAQNFLNKPRAQQLELADLIDVCSFTFWRNRCYGTGVVEFREKAAFDDLPEDDARRELQSEPALKLKSELLPLLVVRQGEDAAEAMLFQDPKERFGDSQDLWWQFVGTESSRLASALVLSSMLACLAAGKDLKVQGSTVKNFGICRGDYIGPVTPLAVEDLSRGNVFTIPRRLPGGKLCKHDWVFVTTDKGEYGIDLAAAQFGDTSRGASGCPSVFSAKADFQAAHKEEFRDEDPIEAYREIFQDMISEREAEIKRPNRPWYKDVNHLDVFVAVSGKVCSSLMLLGPNN